jgi:hypothetical protein
MTLENRNTVREICHIAILCAMNCSGTEFGSKSPVSNHLNYDVGYSVLVTQSGV